MKKTLQTMVLVALTTGLPALVSSPQTSFAEDYNINISSSELNPISQRAERIFEEYGIDLNKTPGKEYVSFRPDFNSDSYSGITKKIDQIYPFSREDAFFDAGTSYSEFNKKFNNSIQQGNLLPLTLQVSMFPDRFIQNNFFTKSGVGYGKDFIGTVNGFCSGKKIYQKNVIGDWSEDSDVVPIDTYNVIIGLDIVPCKLNYNIENNLGDNKLKKLRTK